MSDRKAGYSGDCRGSNHLLCQRTGAKCTCVCHGIAKPPAIKRTPRPPRVKPAVVRVVRPHIRKEQAGCCVSRRDALGRLPIGYCSLECLRRPVFCPDEVEA